MEKLLGNCQRMKYERHQDAVLLVDNERGNAMTGMRRRTTSLLAVCATLAALVAGCCSVCRINAGPPRPDKEQEYAQARGDWVRKAEAPIESKFGQEGKAPDNSSDELRKQFDLALKDADLLVDSCTTPTPPSGKIEEFECRKTICKGKSRHFGEEAYRAFTRTAFGTGDHGHRGWFVISSVDKAGTDRVLVFYVAKAPARTKPLTPEAPPPTCPPKPTTPR
jgi:hypothetical protein